MIAAPRIDEPWPEEESLLVIRAIRSVVRRPEPRIGPSGDGEIRVDREAPEPEARAASERQLMEAAHRWAEAHRSATLMRSRLEALAVLLDEQDEPDRSGYLAAWHRLTEEATVASLGPLERDALTDPLTGAGNRRALQRALSGAVAAARRFDDPLVVVVVDLDGLKRINDTRGHPAGDRALVALAEGMADGLRLSDSVFRSGGDEFAVIVRGAGVRQVTTMMLRLADRGLPSFSWGLATRSAELTDAGDLLAAADADLYRRRRSSRGPTYRAITMVGTGAATVPAAASRRRRSPGAVARSQWIQIGVAMAVLALGGGALAGRTVEAGSARGSVVAGEGAHGEARSTGRPPISTSGGTQVTTAPRSGPTPAASAPAPPVLRAGPATEVGTTAPVDRGRTVTVAAGPNAPAGGRSSTSAGSGGSPIAPPTSTTLTSTTAPTATAPTATVPTATTPTATTPGPTPGRSTTPAQSDPVTALAQGLTSTVLGMTGTVRNLLDGTPASTS